jgi:hypothetical protein
MPPYIVQEPATTPQRALLVTCNSSRPTSRFPLPPRAAPLSGLAYAWDWGAAPAGVLAVQQLGGLPWSHVRLRLLGALMVASGTLLSLLRCGVWARGHQSGVPQPAALLQACR